jgi:hypothetical protein
LWYQERERKKKENQCWARGREKGREEVGGEWWRFRRNAHAYRRPPTDD